MKKADLKLTSLYNDVLKFIILLVVKSSQGVVDMARIIAVCKRFGEFVKDEDLLKTLDFDSVKLSNRIASFQGPQSLIMKCAEAGNLSAQYLISKVILVSALQLSMLLPKGNFIPVDEYINQAIRTNVAEHDRSVSLLAHFMDNQSSNSHQSGGSLCHTQLVRLFMCRCNFADFISLHRHINCYLRMFALNPSQRVGMRSFNDEVNEMIRIFCVLVMWGSKVGLRRSQENDQYLLPAECETELWNCLRSPYGLSGLSIVHHEREYQCKAELPVHVGVGKVNEDAKMEFDNLGDYCSHHLVTKVFAGGLESQNVLCAVFGLDLGKQICVLMVESFERARLNAVKAYDIVFDTKVYPLSATVARRGKRVRRPPKYLKDYVET